MVGKIIVLSISWIIFGFAMYLPYLAMSNGLGNGWGWLYLFNIFLGSAIIDMTMVLINQSKSPSN